MKNKTELENIVWKTWTQADVFDWFCCCTGFSEVRRSRSETFGCVCVCCSSYGWLADTKKNTKTIYVRVTHIDPVLCSNVPWLAKMLPLHIAATHTDRHMHVYTRYPFFYCLKGIMVFTLRPRSRACVCLCGGRNETRNNEIKNSMKSHARWEWSDGEVPANFNKMKMDFFFPTLHLVPLGLFYADWAHKWKTSKQQQRRRPATALISQLNSCTIDSLSRLMTRITNCRCQCQYE